MKKMNIFDYLVRENKLLKQWKVANFMDSNAFVGREITKYQREITNQLRKFQNSEKF